VTLVDTSIWIHHLRYGNDELRELLEKGEVLCHPFVVGELACGSIANRNEVLELLKALPMASIAEHDEVVQFLHERRLYGRGLGWIDMHLLASVILSNATLWTTDRALKKVSDKL